MKIKHQDVTDDDQVDTTDSKLVEEDQQYEEPKQEEVQIVNENDSENENENKDEMRMRMKSNLKKRRKKLMIISRQ